MTWFAAQVQPALPEVYEVRGSTVPLERTAYARWTGEHWCGWGISPEHAQRCSFRCGPDDGYDWRPIC